MELTAVYIAVPEGYIAFVEELPGANTQGDTLDEARAFARGRRTGPGSESRTGGTIIGRSGSHPRSVRPGWTMKRHDLIQHLEAHGCRLV